MMGYFGYSRYSSDNQREASIDDQNRNILRKFAELGIPEDQVQLFSDSGISGMHDNRPDYQRLLAAVEANEVKILIVEDQSRLTRDTDIGDLLNRFRFHRVRFIAIHDGIDTERESTEINAHVKGLVNNMSIKDHAKRVLRGLVGRALDVDGAAGDHPFGYRSEWADPAEGALYIGNGPKPKRRVVVNEKEAVIVRDIFHMFVVEELSLNEIARRLNDKKAPQGVRGTSRTGWSAGRVRMLLKNQKYHGTWIYGKNYTVKYKGHRRDEKADDKDVVVTERPHLAIVTKEMWKLADKRFQRFKEILGPNTGKAKRKKLGLYAREYPFNLLSGLLFCGECGTRLHRGAGNGGAYYRCPTHFRNGRCGSKSSVNKQAAEKVVIAFLEGKLADIDGWFDAVHAQVVATIEADNARIPEEKDNLLRRKADLEKEVETLSANLKLHVSQKLSAELAASEAVLAAIDDELAAMEKKTESKQRLPSKDEVAVELAKLMPIFAEQPTQGALLLRRIIGRITVADVIFPGKQRGYAKLSFRFDPGRLLAAVYEDEALFTPDEQSALAEDVVLYTGKPTKLESLLPQIHEWVREGVSWLAIHNRTGLSASNTSDYYKRWRKALAEAERENGDRGGADQLVSTIA
jgi:DNA invertase Pin-like site-specific DNA recombinase